MKNPVANEISMLRNISAERKTAFGRTFTPKEARNIGSVGGLAERFGRNITKGELERTQPKPTLGQRVKRMTEWFGNWK